MPMRLIALLCLASLTGATQSEAATLTIRCHAARGAVVEAICASPEYVAMDREIAALVDRGLAEFASDDRRHLAEGQATYRKHRDGCGWAAHNSAHPGAAVDECIHATMDARLNALRIVVDRGRF